MNAGSTAGAGAGAPPGLIDRLRHLGRRLRGFRRPDLWLARRIGRVLPDRLYLAVGHLIYFGRWPDYRQPRSFNEHIQAYMLRCRSPLLQLAADKAAARQWVIEQVGDTHVLPQLGLWTHAEAVPLRTLARPCVLKPTVGSGRVIFLRENDPPLDTAAEAALRLEMQRWLDTDFSRQSREWCYSGLRGRLLAEPMLNDPREPGGIPPDHKVYVIGGAVRFIQVDRGRFGCHTRNLYDTDWRLLPARLTLDNHAPDPRPAELDAMIALALKLAAPFEFLRVDLYLCEGRLIVGELTSYPGAGFERFMPSDFALELGAHWTRAMRARPDDHQPA